MTLAIEDLIVAPTSEELFESALSALELVGVPARSWRSGSVARTLLSYGCDVGARGATVVARLVAGNFLLLGSGGPLTAHALDVYGVVRQKVAAATGQVTLSNVSGAVYTIGANQLIVRASSTGARFRVTQAFVLGSGSLVTPATVTVDVMAVEVGGASSVAPGEINELETTLTGVTVSNATQLIGKDEETDAKLVERCLAKRGTWSPFGPVDAYEYAALSAKLTTGADTNITRVSVSRYSSTGKVDVVCATPSGTPTGDELDAVRDEIARTARPGSVTCTIYGATAVPDTDTLVVWARGGVASTIRQRAQTALAALFADYPIGGIAKTDGAAGKLWADRVTAAVINSSPEIYDVDGAVDLALTSTQVPTNGITLDVRIR